MVKQQKPKQVTSSDYNKHFGLMKKWNPILEYVEPIQPSSMSSWKECREYKMSVIYKAYSHPDIESGKAYWTETNILLKGYILKNTQILRPVFQDKREEYNIEVRRDIIRYAKMYAAESRNSLYNSSLLELTNLPQDVIDIILQMSWDILLLLKN